jgi:hypothetical protein
MDPATGVVTDGNGLSLTETSKLRLKIYFLGKN